jgi:hypothetical protein
MSFYSSLPTAEPLQIPMGTYTATPAGDATEQPGNFKDKAGNFKTYFTIPLILVNAKGEEFSYNWNFSKKNPIFLRYLEIMGGFVLPSGKVRPPLENAEKEFTIQITVDVNKDGKKINKVVDVWKLSRTPEVDPITEAEHGKGEDAPF